MQRQKEVGHNYLEYIHFFCGSVQTNSHAFKKSQCARTELRDWSYLSRRTLCLSESVRGSSIKWVWVWVWVWASMTRNKRYWSAYLICGQLSRLDVWLLRDILRGRNLCVNVYVCKYAEACIHVCMELCNIISFKICVTHAIFLQVKPFAFWVGREKKHGRADFPFHDVRLIWNFSQTAYLNEKSA
jgi:hypothetical protein